MVSCHIFQWLYPVTITSCSFSLATCSARRVLTTVRRDDQQSVSPLHSKLDEPECSVHRASALSIKHADKGGRQADKQASDQVIKQSLCLVLVLVLTIVRTPGLVIALCQRLRLVGQILLDAE